MSRKSSFSIEPEAFLARGFLQDEPSRKWEKMATKWLQGGKIDKQLPRIAVAAGEENAGEVLEAIYGFAGNPGPIALDLTPLLNEEEGVLFLEASVFAVALQGPLHEMDALVHNKEKTSAIADIVRKGGFATSHSKIFFCEKALNMFEAASVMPSHMRNLAMDACQHFANPADPDMKLALNKIKWDDEEDQKKSGSGYAVIGQRLLIGVVVEQVNESNDYGMDGEEDEDAFSRLVRSCIEDAAKIANTKETGVVMSLPRDWFGAIADMAELLIDGEIFIKSALDGRAPVSLTFKGVHLFINSDDNVMRVSVETNDHLFGPALIPYPLILPNAGDFLSSVQKKYGPVHIHESEESFTGIKTENRTVH